jgi:hypothetical protein
MWCGITHGIFVLALKRDVLVTMFPLALKGGVLVTGARPRCRWADHRAPAKSKSKPKSHYDQQSVGRLGVRPPSGTRDQFFFLLGILFRQLRVCYFVAPSLTRGRVCNLLLMRLKSKSHYDRRSVGQFVLVSCPFWSK